MSNKMSKLPVFLLICSILSAAEYKAGLGRVIITPEKPMYLSGYANRRHASEGKVHDLWAKALAIEDRKGGRVVILSTDLVGLPRGITDVVGARLVKEYGLDRARLVINSSHTHTGPLIRGNLSLMFELDAAQQARVDEYAVQLIEKLVAVAAAAINDLSPANVWFGNRTARFAAHPPAQGGPSDYHVPV